MPKQANLTKLKLSRYYIKAKVSNNQYSLRCYQFIIKFSLQINFHFCILVWTKCNNFIPSTLNTHDEIFSHQFSYRF